MKKSILLEAVLIALVSLCLVFASCDSGSSSGDDPTPPPVPAPVTYTISFDANGGTGTMNPVSVEEGKDCTIPVNGFTAPAVTEGALKRVFKCWNTASDGTGKPYDAEGIIQATDITAGMKLFAQWANPSFTVNATGKQVYFSKGNLQATYNGSSYTWGFAANQHEYVGAVAGNTTIDSQTSGAKVDLFGWSTASTNYGISSSNDNATYSGSFKDWGEAVGDGETWCTLSNNEWTYLLSTRTVNGDTGEGHSYQKATINSDATGGGVYGMIIYPDNYTAQKTETSYTSDDWSDMENAGCVFLPAAGYRSGSSVKLVNFCGYYWSASINTDSRAYYLYFGDRPPKSTGSLSQNFGSNAGSGYEERSFGQSVRLVYVEK